MSNPTLLQMPLAVNGDKNTIPVETTSNTGLFSQKYGFQSINSLPLSAGGKAISRHDYNGTMYLLSNILFYAQKGYVFEFDSTQDYFTGCEVIDPADDNKYRCIADVAADGDSPSEDTTHWERIFDESVFFYRMPNVTYTVGDVKYAANLPSWGFLTCITGGVAGSGELVIPAGAKAGDTITDGEVVWRLDSLANMKKALAEATGYGIISGCTPTISGLNVTVAAGVVHLADGTRKEIAQTNITLDNADSSNPRIDLVYIDSTGTVAKVTGTAAASPSAPSVPSQGISVAQVSVAANASAGTVTDMRGMLARWYNSGVVNVKDFGAVGDGVTDDMQAIQRAIDSGRVVLFPDGNYLISSSLTYANVKIVLIGIGDNCQITHNDNSNLFALTDCTVIIKNIKIIGTSAGVAFSSTGTEFKLDNVIVNGLASAIIQLSSGGIDHDIKNELKNCRFITTSYGIQYYGNPSYVDFVMSDCYIKTTTNAPYFISGCKYASVERGEYTSDSNDAAPNLYSNNHSDIMGGFYHDMYRGATIGGRTGKRGTIISTKNEGMSYCGISVDLATGYDEPYTEGKIVVMANIIDNCNYGIYAQGKKLDISHNIITMPETSNGSTFGIRFNCNHGTSVDYSSEIKNNIIDCSNNVNVYPIYLGENTVVHEFNNLITNNVQGIFGGFSSSMFIREYQKEITAVPFRITPNVKIYICNDIPSDGYIQVPSPNYINVIGYDFLIINKSNNKLIVQDSTATSNIVSNTGNKDVPAGSMCHLQCIGVKDWIMVVMALS